MVVALVSVLIIVLVWRLVTAAHQRACEDWEPEPSRFPQAVAG